MNHFSFELSLIALIPGLFLCGYIFYKDKVEREPVGLLSLLFVMGTVAYILSAFLQRYVADGIDSLFAGSMQYSAEGALLYSSSRAEFLHKLLNACISFSLVPICIKWAVLYFGTHKTKHFNYLFDGVVYSVFLSLGFAVAEIIHFALQNDSDLLLPKVLTVLPCHLFIGILMGYYYTMWHMRFLVNRIETRLLATKLIAKDKIRSSATWLVSSFVIPTVVSCLYAYASSAMNETVTLAFYSAVFILYGLSFVVIEQLATRESSSKGYICRVIAKSHPELSKEQIETYMLPEEGK